MEEKTADGGKMKQICTIIIKQLLRKLLRKLYFFNLSYKHCKYRNCANILI